MKKHIAPILFLMLFSSAIHAQLVGNWRLDNNATDISGNSYNGTLMNAPTFTTTNKEGSHALSLNGSNQYIDLGNPGLFPAGTSARSISAWAKSNTIGGGYRWIFAYGTASQSNAMFIGMAGADLRGGSYNNDLAQTNYWTVGVWHHICLTYDGTTAKLYADGALLQSLAVSWNLIRGKAYIGRQVSDVEYWNGSIDDVRIYSKALSLSEVQALATSPPTAPTGLTATATSSSAINLTWTDNSSNETGFQVERSLTGGGAGFNLVTTTAANATSYSDASLAAATKYYYRIRSVNAGGNLTYSSEVNATTTGSVITPPTALSATVSSATTVNLAWTDNSANETGFQIERSVTSGSGYSLITTTAANVVSYADPGLTDGTTYYYHVRAINASGNSLYTTEASATTSYAVPAAPSAFTATVVSGTTGSLHWTDNSANETGFQIERSVTSGAGYSLVTTTAANAVSYSDANLSAGTTYYYRIRSTNPGGNSAYATEVSITTAIGGLVAQWPLNNNANDASGNNITGTLMNSPTYSTDSKEGTNSLVLNGTNQYITCGNPSGLPSGYAARTLCAWGKTTVTDTYRWIAAFGTNNGANAMFIGMNGTTLQAGALGDDFTIANKWAVNTWHHVCLTYDGTTAKLYLDGTLVASGARNWYMNLSKVYIGRQVDDAEYWKGQIDDVRIYNKALSATEVLGLITVSPTAPSTLAATAASWTKINLSWTDNSSNETGFQIERSLTQGTGYSLLSTAAANAVSYSDASALAGTKYYYRIRAINAGGNSLYSSEVNATTDGIPSALTLTALSSNTAYLSWTDNSSHETGFGVERSLTAGTGYSLIATTAANATSYEDDNLTTGTTYYYRVRAIGSIENSDYTSESSLIMSSVPPVSQGQVWDATELAALKDLYNNLAGSGWTTKTNWPASGSWPNSVTSAQLATWYGLTVTNGDVTSILLTNNNLTGTIPSTIGNLSQLQALELHQNHISGEIPVEIGNLQNLQYLYLQNNSLTGYLPWELNNCSVLRELVLSNNQLTNDVNDGLTDLSLLYTLNYLGLDHNQFTGTVPDWIGSLPDLWHLFLNDNQFSGNLSSTIGNLSDLINLIVSNNQLTGTFPDVTSLTHLINLSAANNKFTATPNGLISLPAVTTINFDSNELISIPNLSAQANKTHLTLVASNNRIDFSQLEPLIGSGIQALTYAPQKNIHDFTYTGYTNTGSLVVQARNPGLHSTITWEKQQPNSSWSNVNSTDQDATLKTFTRTSPSSTDNGVYRWSMTNTSVIGLTLQSDPITVGSDGGVADIIELSALKDFYLTTHGDSWTNHSGWPAANNWPGSISSTEFANWYGVTVENGDVTKLALDDNLVGGSSGSPMPASISNLQSLFYLSLGHNQLFGTVPASIGTLSHLTHLDLNGNQFSTIQPTINNLSNLTYLDFSDNSLQSNFPNLGALTNLQVLNLSGTNFTYTHWPIPAWLANLTQLKELNLAYADLAPSPVPDLSALTKLEMLNLSGNWNFNISLPSWIPALPNLRILILDGSGLGGTLPSFAGNPSKLEVLSLYSTHFSGSLPDASNLTNLKEIRAANNYFTSVPSSYANLNLRVFDLSGNQLTGTLPSISNWTDLTELRVPGNHFTGDFPSVANLPSLIEISASYNNFTSIPQSVLNLQNGLVFFSNNSINSIVEDVPINSSVPNRGIYLDQNYLDFSQLEYLKTSNILNLTSVPQKNIQDFTYVNYNSGNFTIYARDPGQYSSTILWEKKQTDGSWLNVNTINQNTTQQTFVRTNAPTTDQGVYRWSMTDTQFPGFTLQSVPITVADQGNISDDVEFAALQDLYNSTGGQNWTNKAGWPTPGNWPVTATSQTFASWNGIGVSNHDVTGLALASNNLIGTIPSSIGNLRRINKLDLTFNHLTGPIPPSIGNLSVMTILYLYENNLTGGIPHEIYGLHNLKQLALENNPSLGGEISEDIGNLSNLFLLYLDNNGHTGTIPPSLTKLTQLYVVNLASNHLEGEIPHDIDKLSKLDQLGLGMNNLSGHIPKSLGNIAVLTVIDLSHNNLTGHIPETIKNKSNLSSFVVNNNKLSGTIPVPLFSTNLLLNNNDFTGVEDPSGHSGTFHGLIDISNNHIPIADIEKYFTAAGLGKFGNLTYAPQQYIDLVARIDIPKGGDFKIEGPAGLHNSYTWQRLVNGVWQNINSLNQSSNANEFGIASATDDMAGTYRYTVTNTWATSWSFDSGPITVEIGDASATSGGIKPLFNGLITSLRWHTDKAYQSTESDYEGMYVYDYDEKYQLKDASWADVNNSLDNFTMAANKFRTTAMSYDPNGNIQALHRYDKNGLRTNNFKYHYKNSIDGDAVDPNDRAETNKLLKVDGYVNAYTYNALGQMTGVDKETGDDQYVNYDVTGKVVAVYDNDQLRDNDHLRLEYLYDDRGFRLAKKVYDDHHKLDRTTWYIRDAGGNIISIYEEDNVEEVGNDHSKITQTEVPIYGSGKLGTFYPGQDSSTVYEITDHLGNVRALLRDNVNIYTATMEDNGHEDLDNPRVAENGYFQNLFETEKQHAGQWLNHTPPNSAVPDPNVAVYLDGTGQRIIGPAIALCVNAGDVFDMKVYGKFEESGSYGSSVPLASIVSSLASTYAFAKGFETVASATQAFNSSFASIGLYGSNNDERPRAFLNYILFDKNMNYVGSGFDQMNADAGFVHNQENTVDFDTLKLEVRAPNDGFIYVYISNETPGTPVWFDDLTVKHTGVMVTQSTDYEAWGNVLREQKTDPTVYRFGYQGQFSEKDLETGWNHFELREYDPTIARWMSTDPKRIDWSPYIGMYNNPVSGTDLDGGGPGIGESNGKGQRWNGSDWVSGQYDEVVVSPTGYENFDGVITGYQDPGYFPVNEFADRNSFSPPTPSSIGDYGPVISAAGGDVFMDCYYTYEDLNNGDYASASMNAGFAFIPWVSSSYVRSAKKISAITKSKVVIATIDATGKVHGTLPKVEEFGKYAKEDLEILLKDLKESVQKRIEVTSKLGRDRGHGQRQGEEQDLIKSLEKYLSGE